MNYKWKVEGANWTWELETSLSDVGEIAALCVEDVCEENPRHGILFNDEGKEVAPFSEYPYEFGAVMKVTNDQMKSIDEHLFILAEPALANAGYHGVAKTVREQLEREMAFIDEE